MDAYNDLLEATISHLTDLKRQGTRYVPVTPDLLKSLTAPRVRSAVQSPASPQPPASPVRTAPSSAVFPGAGSAPTYSTSGSVPAAAPAKAATIPSVLDPEPALVTSKDLDKLSVFAQLRDRALVCQKCSNLVASRKNVVFGVGSINAELMFIGEAPGAEEDEQAEPFVGRAGQLLTKVIQTMGLSREQVYIANILKCRPDTPGQDYGNRPPTPEEIERCLPYLHAQIDLIKPKAIVALGATAVDGLFGKVPGLGITKLRGKWREYRGIPVMPTYHPSYLLRPNPNNIKRETWEDMLEIMNRLKMPISEKQRGYFLKPSV